MKRLRRRADGPGGLRWKLAAFCPALLLVAAGCGRIGSAPQALNSPASSHEHIFIRVRSAVSDPAPTGGRLLIFMKQTETNLGSGDSALDPAEFQSNSNSPVIWMAAKEVGNLSPGETVDVDADEIAYPKPFSAMPPGDYEAQAVLDVGHTYNYLGNNPANWTSDVMTIKNWNARTSAEPVLNLSRHPAEKMKRKAARLLSIAVNRFKSSGIRLEEMTSPALSRFWGRPVKISAWIVLPAGYAGSKERYPVAYWTHGFGGGLDSALYSGGQMLERMNQGKLPPMIWVMLSQSIAQGTHEFTDSVNNGPWGAALTTEFIPYLEGKYRMDARPSGRLLTGHSSGGWATLQLQVNYPGLFGGTWSTSPDCSDFHDFSGVDLYAPRANLYRRADGTPTPIMRENGLVLQTIEQSAKQERVLGPYGGQWSSFDWVFSPRGADGSPRPMFDRETGDVDPEVIAYWRDHYDLALLVESNWPLRAAELKGKFHVTVGTADTFYLDGAVHKFDAVLQRLGGNPHFTYLKDRTHSDLYAVGDDSNGLVDQIGAEMYTVARPGVIWKAKQ